ncbi:MAG: hypothetical protein WAL71_09865 [Terriglobales bacterium]|jgi:hypothetical protein
MRLIDGKTLLCGILRRIDCMLPDSELAPAMFFLFRRGKNGEKLAVFALLASRVGNVRLSAPSKDGCRHPESL